MLQHTAIRSIHAAFLSVVLGSVTLTACNQSPPPAPPASKPTESTPGSSLPDEPWVNFTTGANIKAMALEGDILWLGLSNGMIRYDTRTIDAHEVFTPASTNGGLMSKGIYTVKVDGQIDQIFDFDFPLLIDSNDRAVIEDEQFVGDRHGVSEIVGYE